MVGPPSFKTVNASVRPARVAVLIDKSDEDWQDTCLHVVEFFSQIWGGAYNLIVPTDGRTIDERFWTILEAFDADNLYVYRKSGEDIKFSRPEQYQKLLESHVTSWIAQYGEGGLEHVREDIDKQLRGAWASDFSIAAELQTQIKIRLSPFYFEEWVVEAGAIGAKSGVSFPLTSLVKIIRNAEHPDRFATVNAPAGLLPRLWYSATCGLLRDKAVGEFEAAGLTQHRYDFEEADLGHLIEFVVNGEIRGSWAIEPNSRVFDLNGAAPFQVSMLQLGLYRPTKYPAWSEPMVLVAGNTVDDFCLYYCLSRLRERVTWVLPSITGKALGSPPSAASRVEASFISQLHRQRHSQQSQGGLAYASYSLTDPELEAVIARMSSPLGPLQSITKAKEVKHLVRMPLVVTERDNFQRDIVVQMSGDLAISPFSTPKPKNFHFIDPREHRYIAQLSVAGEAPPKHFRLGAWVFPDHRLTTKDVRVGSTGPAYFCPGSIYFGGDIDTALVRPPLRLPPLHKILVELARKQGYDCRPSDKGIYADETIAKWGGLEEASRFLRFSHGKDFMDQFLDQSRSEPGKGVYLRDDRRRYLDYSAISAHFGGATANIIDELISKRVLYRGFVFSCAYCRNSTWFSVAEISQDFTCKRCNRKQTYTKIHWKKPDEPAWFYKLDELVYQGYRHGMAVSLLALNYLMAESSENFSFATDREFWKPDSQKAEAEADFFCVSDGVLTIGEAKKENRLGASTSEENAVVKKYKLLSEGLSVRRFVLATLSEDWNPATTERVLAAFKETPWVQVRFLAARQLFNLGSEKGMQE
jgi:hypothetical protein